MVQSQSDPSGKPKVFISYSWSSPRHQEQVRLWAEQLIADGVEVLLDVFDLREGQDKYAFMERMVTDPSVSNVLILSDKAYSEKADSRKAGVGAESQIISKEVYDKVDQHKFIPVVCQFSEDGEPCLPAFLQSRIWLDFSSSEKANENWERLVRTLYGKPLMTKPALGNPPAYLTESTESPFGPALARFRAFEYAFRQGKPGLRKYRQDFLRDCVIYADALRVRQQPEAEVLGQKVLEDCGRLKQVRNLVVDWILLESEEEPRSDFADSLLQFLEELLELKSRPVEVTRWYDVWFEAHSLFVYETFLYVVASLLRTRSFKILNLVFTSHYLIPEARRGSDTSFGKFDRFYGHSATLQEVLGDKGRRLFSPAAELIRRQADRTDLPFKSIMEAELLVLLMTYLTPDTDWYPGTLHYVASGQHPEFFLRATQHRHFEGLATITGVESAEKLRQLAAERHEQMKGRGRWSNFAFGFGPGFWSLMNMDNLDSLI